MKGFTVLEATVTLAVAAILAAFAWQSFVPLLAGQRLSVTVNALVASLQTARHASVMQRDTTIVCASADGVRCGGDWSSGWVAFSAPRGWRRKDPVPDAGVLRRGDPARGVAVRANRALFRFRPHGRSTNGTFVLCSSGGRIVVVSPTGRVRSGPAEDGSC